MSNNEDRTYNGWSNYETWYINLSFFDDELWIEHFLECHPNWEKDPQDLYQSNYQDAVAYLKQLVEDWVCGDLNEVHLRPVQETMIACFLQDVNFSEILDKCSDVLQEFADKNKEEDDSELLEDMLVYCEPPANDIEKLPGMEDVPYHG